MSETPARREEPVMQHLQPNTDPDLEWAGEEESECEGHESLSGAFHGVSYFCDGSCT
jgi:hypothetical protein